MLELIPGKLEIIPPKGIISEIFFGGEKSEINSDVWT
jgi:hypothetical protein